MKIKPKEISAKIMPALLRLRRFMPILFILLFASIYSFLILRINTLTSSKPNESDVLEELQSVSRPKIDEEAAKKIEQLEAQNIEVRTLFEEARRNPFAE